MLQRNIHRTAASHSVFLCIRRLFGSIPMVVNHETKDAQLKWQGLEVSWIRVESPDKHQEKMGRWGLNQWDRWFHISFRSQTQIKIQALCFFHRELPVLAIVHLPLNLREKHNLTRPEPDSDSFNSWKKFKAEEILPAISAFRTRAWRLRRHDVGSSSLGEWSKYGKSP